MRAFLLLAFCLAINAGAQSPADAPPVQLVRQGGYTLGPKGGCYTITASGRKRYVDRSLCTGGGRDRNGDRGDSTRSGDEVRRFGGTEGASSGKQGSSRYQRGPRGGCYYLTPSGRKNYVDRSLCN